ncbi:MAG: hypothetical protein V9G10_14400 [Candidatus Nanopelagicales bacterium]
MADHSHKTVVGGDLLGHFRGCGRVVVVGEVLDGQWVSADLATAVPFVHRPVDGVHDLPRRRLVALVVGHDDREVHGAFRPIVGRPEDQAQDGQDGQRDRPEAQLPAPPLPDEFGHVVLHELRGLRVDQGRQFRRWLLLDPAQRSESGIGLVQRIDVAGALETELLLLVAVGDRGEPQPGQFVVSVSAQRLCEQLPATGDVPGVDGRNGLAGAFSSGDLLGHFSP